MVYFQISVKLYYALSYAWTGINRHKPVNWLHGVDARGPNYNAFCDVTGMFFSIIQIFKKIYVFSYNK